VFSSRAPGEPRSGRAVSGGPAILLTTINAKWIHPSLALRLLKANLGDLEGDCEILELALRQPLAEKLSVLRSRRPGVLGISVSIWNHRATLELLEALEGEWGPRPASPAPRESPPFLASSPERRPVVVLGGPEVSSLPEEAEIFRHADYVIRGEGEETFRELCEILLGQDCGQDNRRVPPTWECAQDTGSPCFINGTPVDLDRIRQAYYYYSDEDLTHKLVYVESSRGCPFCCGFCQSADSRVREFPLEPFLDEVDRLIRRGARNFKFLDRSFNTNVTRALAIMDFFLRHIEAEPRTGAPLCVHFEMFPGPFPPELRETLRRFPAGTLRLEIGIQTLNPHVSTLIKRPANGEASLELLRFLRAETRATIHADLIAALPGETIDSLAIGFDKLWLALSGPTPTTSGTPATAGQVEIQLGILKVLPGTPLAHHSAAWGIHHAPLPPYEALSTATLPRPDLDRVKNFARFWEILINRRPFPDLSIAPAGRPVFRHFMELSGKLLTRFGKNWGIDKQELRAAVLEMTQNPS
jgi:hypothetical protein